MGVTGIYKKTVQCKKIHAQKEAARETQGTRVAASNSNRVFGKGKEKIMETVKEREEAPYGDWMVVTRKKKRSKNKGDTERKDRNQISKNQFIFLMQDQDIDEPRKNDNYAIPCRVRS